MMVMEDGDDENDSGGPSRWEVDCPFFTRVLMLSADKRGAGSGSRQAIAPPLDVSAPAEGPPLAPASALPKVDPADEATAGVRNEALGPPPSCTDGTWGGDALSGCSVEIFEVGQAHYRPHLQPILLPSKSCLYMGSSH